MLLFLSLAFASDDCSLFEIHSSHPVGGCNLDDDYAHQETAPATGNLALHWVPECVDGGSSCPAEERVRCIDGTRPAYHAELNPASDDWVIYFQGGGSCAPETAYDTASNTLSLVYGAWSKCETAYGGGKWSQMTTDLVPTHVKGTGILSSRQANPFRDANKIKIHKCSFDRMAGMTTQEGYATGNPDDGVLYFHGRRIAKAILSDLASNQTLANRFEKDDRVLFAGNSGGAGGLIMSGDKYTSWIHDELDLPGVQTRLLLDGRMKPSLENNAAFDPTKPPNSDLYDHYGTGESEYNTTPDSFQYKAITYRQLGGVYGPSRSSYEEWFGGLPAARDASCKAAHPQNPWKCYDEGHVLANHLETPFFASHSTQDGNHATGRVPYAEDANGYGELRWNQVCSDADVNAVPPRSSGNCHSAYGEYALEQASQIHDHHTNMGLWTIATADQHVQIYEDYWWGNTGAGLCIPGAKVTLGQAVWNWFDTGATTWFNEHDANAWSSWDPAPNAPPCP